MTNIQSINLENLTTLATSFQNTNSIWNLPNIPKNDSEIVSLTTESNLNDLYIIANSLVAAIFAPFDQVSDFLIEGFESGDFLAYLSEESQSAAVITASVPFIITISFALLFIAISVIYGIIYAIFRCGCCCNNNICGHTDYQSQSKGKSGWRFLHPVILLLILAMLIIICVFIFLTNEWVTDIVSNLPDDISVIFSNLNLYIVGISDQIDYYISTFDTVAKSTLDYVNRTTELIVEPILSNLTMKIDPTFEGLLLITPLVQSLTKTMDESDAQLLGLGG